MRTQKPVKVAKVRNSARSTWQLHKLNEGSAQVNEGSLKLKTYGILCEYVKPVGLKLLKCWFSFVCGADGTGLTNTRKHVQVTKV